LLRVREQDAEDRRRRQEKGASPQQKEVEPESRSSLPDPFVDPDPPFASPLDRPHPACVRSVHVAPFSPGVRSFFHAFGPRPKAELHLHLEGAIAPATLVRLSRRFREPMFPDLASVRARQRVGDFRDFLALYRDVCRCLKSPTDYAAVARDLVRRLSRENISYAEVYVSPAVVEAIGLDWVAVRSALEPVFRRFENGSRRRIVVLLDSVRQWGPDAAHRVLDHHEASPWPRVGGFGLGGDESSVPAREFRGVFDRARRLALAPLIHAGEWAGAESVAAALEELRPVRIAHGFRAAEEKSVVTQLVRLGTPLDICPTSNMATRALTPGERHPVLELFRAGVRVSLSTDDPGLFRSTLRTEFLAVARLGATARELRALLSNGFGGALRPVSPRGRGRRPPGISAPQPRH
jgi:adenosine deaminase